MVVAGDEVVAGDGVDDETSLRKGTFVFKATLTCVPTNPAAPVTNIENPFRVRILEEDLTPFSQAIPPHELVFKDLREGSDEIDEYGDGDDDGLDDDLKKKTKINPRNTKLQNGFLLGGGDTSPEVLVTTGRRRSGCRRSPR